MEQTRVEEEEGEKLWGNEEKGNWAICLGISYSQTFVVAAVGPRWILEQKCLGPTRIFPPSYVKKGRLFLFL